MPTEDSFRTRSAERVGSRSEPVNLRRKTVVTVISKIGDRRPRADACLVVIYGQNIGHKFPVKPGELMIGRSSQAHLQIDHESVSRRHARVVTAESSVTVSDLGSTNGTYVNDEPVDTRELRDGDLIKVGRTILKYLSSNNVEAAYHEEIYRLTTVDGLTRCYNRRHLREQLIREVSRATRYQRPLGMLTFDVDGFKRLNEEYGHLAGDAVLAQIGKRIARRIRREDVFARYGGGEFALVVPESSRELVTNLGHRISEIVGESTFGFDDITIPVTISVGVATLDEIDEEQALNTFSEESTQETDADPFNTDTSDVYRTAETDKFSILALALHQKARERMMHAKELKGSRSA